MFTIHSSLPTIIEHASTIHFYTTDLVHVIEQICSSSDGKALSKSSTNFDKIDTFLAIIIFVVSYFKS